MSAGLGRDESGHRISFDGKYRYGVHEATGATILARVTCNPSRRLRFPIGRRERLANILGWTVTSDQVKRGTLTQECDLALRDRNGYEERTETPSIRKRGKPTVTIAWHPGRPYDRMGVTVLLGLIRRQATQTNKRQGWRPDGSEA